MSRQEDQIVRARDFLDAYGVSADQRAAFPDLVLERLKALVAFMEKEAAQGSERYLKDIDEGHHRLFAADIGYIRVHRRRIAAGVMATWSTGCKPKGRSCHKAAARWSADRLPIAAAKSSESHIVAGSFLNPSRRPRQYVAVHAITEE
ncbi:hypothetical protein EV130_103295 [Rhizobium azibense]|uniref:Uncharacterized protein n=1 Tax=Rhizobium azibense TaxID=1136135 RepID=A0A4R3RQQ4_9HYPH|nr:MULTISPECIES: hypothetical protein [Rhizobium]TCU27890.1 hypothetical protein EV130_103295 [Rhizobium azibense]TCU37324.1 hypothetical protein EV129_106287 [Rhizobium azibense]